MDRGGDAPLGLHPRRDRPRLPDRRHAAPHAGTRPQDGDPRLGRPDLRPHPHQRVPRRAPARERRALLVSAALPRRGQLFRHPAPDRRPERAVPRRARADAPRVPEPGAARRGAERARARAPRAVRGGVRRRRRRVRGDGQRRRAGAPRLFHACRHQPAHARPGVQLQLHPEQGCPDRHLDGRRRHRARAVAIDRCRGRSPRARRSSSAGGCTSARASRPTDAGCARSCG